MAGTSILQANAKCDKCAAESKVILPYGPHRFCAGHFNEFFEHRVRKTIRMNQLIKYGEKIAIGVSGGKDSMVALHLINKTFGKKGLNKIEAIIIDEGIKGYRDKSLEIARGYCEAEGIQHHIVRIEEELGIDMEKALRRVTEGGLGAACSYCGVFRRRFLNQKAKETSADKLATGHNLDDECQSIAMNLFGNDSSRLSRIGEEAASGANTRKLVPRIKPLYDTPEKDIIAYAALNGIEHYSEECCPYSWTAKRNYYRKMLNELESQFPGTKHGIIASFRKLKPALAESEKKNATSMMECENCGEPANSELCATCRQLEKLRETLKQKPGEHPNKVKEFGLSCAVTKGM